MRTSPPAGTGARKSLGRITRSTPRRTLRLVVLGVVAGVLIPALAMAYLSTAPGSDRDWFWQNPLPQGNHLRSMAWVGTTDGWAVGVSGTALRTTDAGRTWIAQDPNTTQDLTGVSFATTSTGWAVGTGGTIRTTSNGGTTWTSQSSGVSFDLRSVSFANASVGVAVGDAGGTFSTIRYTSNGGATWQAATTTSTVALTGVRMVSATTGWAVGASGRILKTVDGGANWTVQPSPTTAGLSAIAFAPGGTVGFIVGNAALPNFTIYKTINSGATWTSVTGIGTVGAVNLLGVDVLDANNAVVVGVGGLIRRTTNGGTAWTIQSQSNAGSVALRDVKQFDANNDYVIGDDGEMFYSRNAGASWFTLASGSSASWLAADFADVNRGWAVGTNGAVMRTGDAGQTWEHQAAGIATWRAVNSFDATTAWIAGDAGAIRKTINGVDWVAQTSGTTQQLNGLHFLTNSTGFAVGNGGTILRTTNGTSWNPRTSGTTANLNAIWFADQSNGWAVGAGGVIRVTTNGGSNWSTLVSGTTQDLLAVHGTSATSLWVTGANGTVRKYNGSTWTDQTTAAGVGANPVRTVFFADANTGWIASTFGIVKKTIDGGTTWTSQNAGLPTSVLDSPVVVNSAWFANATTGFLFGDSGAVRRTTNGGTDWLSLQYGTLNSLNAIMFPDATNGWAAGMAGSMMRTTNAGQTWVQQKTGVSASLNDVWMTDTLSGWAVGDSGTIRRTTDGGLVWSAQTSGVTNNLATIAAGDASHAIVAGSGVVKYTSTSGSTWTSASVLPTLPVTAVSMPDANNAWAVTTRVSGTSDIWHSIDGGATWAAQSTTATVSLRDVAFFDTNVGYAAGDSGVVLRTVDGGVTWIRCATPTAANLNGLTFTTATSGWVVGAGGLVIRTIDGGVTWTQRSSGTQYALSSIAFAGTTRGWIVGAEGTMLRDDTVAPPATSIALDPVDPNGQSGWYSVTAPTITLTSSSPGATRYGWASAAGPFDDYAAPFAALEGTRTLYYFSIDADGNAETVKTRVIKTDVTNPATPDAPSMVLVATSTATVSWPEVSDTVSGVGHYRVYVDGSFATSTTATTASLTGLAPNTLHAITVRAVDRAGNLSASSADLALLTYQLDSTPYTTALGTSVTFPDGANGWFVTTPTVSLTSLPADAQTRYTYYSWTGAVPTPDTTYTAPLTPPAGLSTLYYWTWDPTHVRADEFVQSQLFKVDTATPAQPSITAAATDYRSIRADWSPVPATPSGIDHYLVFLNGLPYTTVTSPFVEITGLEPSTTYTLAVTAVSGAGTTSTVSANATADTPASPMPLAPAIVYAKSPTGASVYLNWTPSDDAGGAVYYHVWRSVNGVDFSTIATTTEGLLDCSYTDTGLASSTRYWYAVSTVDARGESPLSASTPYTAPLTLRPQRPLGTTVTGLGGVAFVQWDPSADPAILGYYVLRAPASLSATITTLTVVPTTATGYFDFSANVGEPYWYSVRAVDASGAISFPSIEAEGRVTQVVPGAEAHPHHYGDGASTCICHSEHVAAGSDTLIRFAGVSSQTMCPTCHAPGNSYQEFIDPLVVSKHAEGATPTVDEPFTCLTCHVPLNKFDEDPANLLRVNGYSPCVETTDTPAGNGFCYKCHGTGSTLPQGDMTVFESSGHRTIPAPATGADVTCDACHESHASRNTGLLKYEGYMVCMQCHTASAANPDQVDIYSLLTLNDGANTKHPLLPQDQVSGARMQCQNCHNTHVTTTALPLVDPHNPSPSGTWPNPRSDQKAFCFRCHNGQPLPTGAETQPWAEPVLGRNSATTTVDIEAMYANNVHGFASRSAATTTTAYLRPDMQYSYGDVLDCHACHESHGTANKDALNSDILSASGDKTIRGVLVANVGGGVTDYRFFCNTCHIWSSATHDSRAQTSTVSFPTNCGACHTHALGGVPGGGF